MNGFYIHDPTKSLFPPIPLKYSDCAMDFPEHELELVDFHYQSGYPLEKKHVAIENQYSLCWLQEI